MNSFLCLWWIVLSYSSGGTFKLNPGDIFCNSKGGNVLALTVHS